MLLFVGLYQQEIHMDYHSLYSNLYCDILDREGRQVGTMRDIGLGR